LFVYLFFGIGKNPLHKNTSGVLIALGVNWYLDVVSGTIAVLRRHSLAFGQLIVLQMVQGVLIMLAFFCKKAAAGYNPPQPFLFISTV